MNVQIVLIIILTQLLLLSCQNPNAESVSAINIKQNEVNQIVEDRDILSVEVPAQSKLDLKNNPIKNDLLVEILSNSQMKELAPPLPKHSNYFLRLYSIGEFGTCAPEVEKEVTCSIRYYLAVSDGSLGVLGAVYDLGEVGEITDVRWLENSNSNIDKLRLEISNYPSLAFSFNPKLIKKTRIVELDVSLESLEVKVIK